MTRAKGVRVPTHSCTRVTFKEPLALYSTDVVELDFSTHRALITNRAGKVKASVPFKVEADGTETTAGD